MADSVSIPYGDEVHAVDASGRVTRVQLRGILDNSEGGVSICVRRDEGHEHRGGYFFHIRKIEGEYLFKTFDGREAWIANNFEDVISFVNHVCGFEYDEDMWDKAQYVNMIEESYE